jgi:hypothetical protein
MFFPGANSRGKSGAVSGPRFDPFKKIDNSALIYPSVSGEMKEAI